MVSFLAAGSGRFRPRLLLLLRSRWCLAVWWTARWPGSLKATALNLCRFPGHVGIARCYADEAFAGDVDLMVVGCGHGPALLIEHFDLDDGYVCAVRFDLVRSGGRRSQDCQARGLALFSKRQLTGLGRLNCAGLVLDLPLHVAEGRNLLTAEAGSHLPAVRPHPYWRRPRPESPRLPFAGFSVGRRESTAPCATTPAPIEEVNPESAHIDNAKLRVRPKKVAKSGLAAVIEAGPWYRRPLACAVKLPPLLGAVCPDGMVEVVGADGVAQLVGGVNSTRVLTVLAVSDPQQRGAWGLFLPVKSSEFGC